TALLCSGSSNRPDCITGTQDKYGRRSKALSGSEVRSGLLCPADVFRRPGGVPGNFCGGDYGDWKQFCRHEHDVRSGVAPCPRDWDLASLRLLEVQHSSVIRPRITPAVALGRTFGCTARDASEWFAKRNRKQRHV